MNQTIIKSLAKKSERGQAIILLAFAFIGLIAMVGLVTDTGLLLIEYGKLKRSVDAAAVAAAQEYRPDPLATPDPVTGIRPLNLAAMENAARTFLQINQINNLTDVVVHTCENTGADRPDLCNPDPDGNPTENRKLVEVIARSNVSFAFLRVLGINSAEVVVTSIGEAATIDLVLMIDTSGSMAYDTEGQVGRPDPDSPGHTSQDNPRVCNWTSPKDTCLPLRGVKDVALEFVDSLIYFGYDRVSVISMTGQQASDATSFSTRDPVEVIPLTFNRTTVLTKIDNLKVFQPRRCAGTDGRADFEDGECLRYNASGYEKPVCPRFENVLGAPDEMDLLDPSTCPSSNIGGVLGLAAEAFEGSHNTVAQRPEALWVAVLIASGPANATSITNYPYGCPRYTWFSLFEPPNRRPTSDPRPMNWCRDGIFGNERGLNSPDVSFDIPKSGTIVTESNYDAEDYARDLADNLAAMKTGNGVTIYTIGLGYGVSTPTVTDPGYTYTTPAPGVDCTVETTLGIRRCGEAEYLLTYIAREAGNNVPDSNINHGEYFYSPDTTALRTIFEIIAQNVATKISQ